MTVALSVHHETFPAMGSAFEIVLLEEYPGQALAAIHHVRQLAASWEARFSRFRADSELSRLNSQAGRPSAVTAEFYWTVERALRAARETGGIFNPLVLPNLMTLGYNRPFHELAGSHSHPVQPATVPAFDLIRLDPASRTITLPAGSALDLGGIAKGIFVDKVADWLSGFPAGIVSAGGDMRVWGRLPGSHTWTIGLEHPERQGEDILDIQLVDGAIATSGTNRRSWKRGATVAHHLIDPRTGVPATTTVRSVSVVARTTQAADVLATVLFIDEHAASSTELGLRSRFALAIAVDRVGSTRVIEGEQDLDVSIHETITK